MNKLLDILSVVLRISRDEINNETSMSTCSSWDSFNHLLIVNEIEKKMNISLAMSEIEEATSFLTLKNIIREKMNESVN